MSRPAEERHGEPRPAGRARDGSAPRRRYARPCAPRAGRRRRPRSAARRPDQARAGVEVGDVGGREVRDDRAARPEGPTRGHRASRRDSGSGRRRHRPVRRSSVPCGRAPPRRCRARPTCSPRATTRSARGRGGSGQCARTRLPPAWRASRHRSHAEPVLEHDGVIVVVLEHLVGAPAHRYVVPAGLRSTGRGS